MLIYTENGWRLIGSGGGLVWPPPINLGQPVPYGSATPSAQDWSGHYDA